MNAKRAASDHQDSSPLLTAAGSGQRWCMVGTGANLMSVSSSLFLRSLERRLIRNRKKQKLPTKCFQLRVAHHGKTTDLWMRLQAQLSLLVPDAIRTGWGTVLRV